MFWDNLRSDIRFTLRQATRAPGFTSLAVAALALGIGANSAVFSVVNGVLLRPLPYHEPERLVMVWSDNRNEGRSLNVVSPANFTDFRARSRTFSGLDYSASFLMRLTVRGEEDAPPVWTLRTGASLFEVLGRQAALGRTYRAGERGVAVVSHNYWVTRLGANPQAIGRSLTLSGNEVVTIIGVMPPDFAFPYRSMFGPWVSGGAMTADLWIPMPLEGPRWVTAGGSLVRNVHSLVTIGRLAPGVSLEQARADLRGIAVRLENEFPDSNRGWGTTVVSLMDQTVGVVRPALLIVLVGVGLILLMAAVNYASNPPNSPFIAIRASSDPAAIAAAVRREARAVEPGLSLYDIRTMEAIRSESIAERRFLLILLSVFGSLALLLASVGVYGVMSLVVSERTQEMGVRLALGAEPSTVLAMVVRQAAGLAGLGVVIGLIAAAAFAPLMASQLFGVSVLDPTTFLTVPAIL